jgi:hypothetical protein
MPTMLLRRATQVVNRINKETAFEVDSTDPDEFGYRRRRRKVQTLVASTSVSIDADPRRRVDALRIDLLERFERMIRLAAIATHMRQAIGQKQAECGVTGLVTERVMVVRNQAIVQSLLSAVNQNTYNPEEFESRVNAMKDRLSRGQSNQVTSDISTVLLTADDRKNLQEMLLGLNRRLLQIDDQLAGLNASNSVQMSDEDEAYLREVGMI